MTETYRKWLTAAYRYYVSAAPDTGMTDEEWDQLSRLFYKERHKMTLPEHAPLHHEDFTGGSLFWLAGADYPDWAKV